MILRVRIDLTQGLQFHKRHLSLSPTPAQTALNDENGGMERQSKLAEYKEKEKRKDFIWPP